MSLRTTLITCAAVAGVVTAALGFTAMRAQAETQSLEWRVKDNHQPSGLLDLTLTLRSPGHLNSNGHGVALSELRGLTAAQLAGGATTTVHFRLTRDAGAFDCEGSARNDLGSGDCAFQPGHAFAQRLAGAGFGPASDDQLLRLALHDIGGAYLDEVRRQDYGATTVSELIRVADHGVNLRYLREMGGAGYRLGRLGALADLRDHGVNSRFIQALADAGYRNLPVDLITQLRDHGVSPDYITGMAGLGYARLQPEDLIRLRDHGVTVAYATELRNLGLQDLSPGDLVRLRDHGVSTSYIRRVSADGRLSAEEIIRMRDRGER